MTTIIDLRHNDTSLIAQLATVAYAAFQEHAPGWLPTVAAAREEVLESLEPGKFCRVLIDEQRTPLGWIGAIPQSSGRIWEIHPMMVAPVVQGRGYGRRLLTDIERLAQARCALTLLVGTSDATNATSLSGVDLYANPAHAIATFHAHKSHPYRFYTRLGFRIVGLIPDADGVGKPGITLAKRVGTFGAT